MFHGKSTVTEGAANHLSRLSLHSETAGGRNSPAVFSRRTGRELHVVSSQPSNIPNSVKFSDAHGQELLLTSDNARVSFMPSQSETGERL